MTTQGSSKHFGTLNAQVDAAIFDAGYRGLGDATQLRELSLAEPLKFAENSNGLTRRNVYSFLGRAEVAHLGSPIIVRCDANHLDKQCVCDDLVDYAPLLIESGRAEAFPFAT